MHRGVRVEIDLGAAAANLGAVRAAARGAAVIAVVKADAYGHGAPALARTFREAGAEQLAVAFVSEARDLRKSGDAGPLLVLFDRTEPGAFFDLGLTPVIHDLGTARELSREAGRRGTKLGVHLKMDTGMGRMGFAGPRDLLAAADLPGLEATGLMSHFSDADIEDKGFVKYQLQAFHEVRAALAEKGISPLCHMANSAAALSCPEARLDAVRPGLALYGCSPFEGGASPVPLRPVMRASARVLALRRVPPGRPISYARTFVTRRETLAAVLAAGYADGYPRSCSNRASVLLRGVRAPVLGRVCMDLTVVDATDIEGASEGDEAVLLGASGAEHISGISSIPGNSGIPGISPWELAGWAGTIPYEILSSLGGRARRTPR